MSVNQLTFSNKNSFKEAKVTNPFLEERSYLLAHAGHQQIAETPKIFMSYEEALKYAQGKK